MKNDRFLGGLAILLIAIAAMLSFGPWYHTRVATIYLSLVKWLSLASVAVVGFAVFRRSETGSGGRRPWLLLFIGFAFFAAGQAVLVYHQVFHAQKVAFPSLGDAFFVICCPFYVAALFLFCRASYRSGLPLGRFWAFWSPALVVGILMLATAYPLAFPVVEASGEGLEVFLNLYYMAASFCALAPCLVMLRVGFKFRGGRLLGVWLPVTIGFAVVLTSDILFAYLTSLGIRSVQPTMDFLYLAGYVLVARGVFHQLALMRA